LQALIILLSPYLTIYSLTPTFALAIYKVAKTVLIANGVLQNPHMKDVRLGRTTAVFPESDGSFNREKGESFGGEGVCVMLLSSKCNQYVPSPHSPFSPHLIPPSSPLGTLYPPYATLLSHGQKMFIELEKNAVEYGFLGTSSYVSTDDATKPVGLQIIYFKDLEHCYKFAHSAATHRKGWEWFNGMGKGVECVSIAHEVFDVPRGRWENIWVNAKPYGFGTYLHWGIAVGRIEADLK
jgi:hypothetical protein